MQLDQRQIGDVIGTAFEPSLAFVVEFASGREPIHVTLTKGGGLAEASAALFEEFETYGFVDFDAPDDFQILFFGPSGLVATARVVESGPQAP